MEQIEFGVGFYIFVLVSPSRIRFRGVCWGTCIFWKCPKNFMIHEVFRAKAPCLIQTNRQEREVVHQDKAVAAAPPGAQTTQTALTWWKSSFSCLLVYMAPNWKNSFCIMFCDGTEHFLGYKQPWQEESNHPNIYATYATSSQLL